MQLYRSAAMACFLVVYLGAIARGSPLFLREWVLPLRRVLRHAALRVGVPQALSGILGPFNVFHLLCLAMIAYSLVMIESKP